MIKQYLKLLFKLIFLIALIQCKGESSADKPNDSAFRLYNLESAGWKSKTLSHYISGMSYKATQVPLQYYILKNGSPQDPISVDSIYKFHSRERIIEFEFEHESKDDLLKSEYTRKSYAESVKYMSFKMQNDFEIITSSGKKVKCSGVTFERNFKVAPFKRALLHFTNIPENENIQLLYEDKLFGNGLFKYNFKEIPIKL